MPKRRLLVVFLVSAVALSAANAASFSTAQTSPVATAQAVLRDASGTQVGLVYFSEVGGGKVLVEVSGQNLPPGFHGFHVHDVGSCVAPSFTSAGGHFNPGSTSHGEHAGDMPVLRVADDGTLKQEFQTDRFTALQILAADTAVIIHAKPDNYANIPATDIQNPDGTFAQRAYYFDADASTGGLQPSPGPAPDTTLKTGDAGGRIACGVVEAAPSPTPTPMLTPPIEQARAQATLRNAAGDPIGQVTFIQLEPGEIRVIASVNGLPPGFHGFHVHDVGSCVAPSFTSAGGHFNPGSTSHGEHAGDLPVLLAAQDGTAVSRLRDPGFTVEELIAADVAVVVHARPDNYANIPATDIQNPDGTFAQRAYYFDADAAAEGIQPSPGPAPDTTLKTGDAGGRVACGEVRSTQTTPGTQPPGQTQTPTATMTATATATATATVPPGGFPRTVALEASKNRKTFGRNVTFTGAVRSPDADLPPACYQNVTVKILRDIVGGGDDLVQVATVTTGEDGTFSYSRTADRSANYVAHLDQEGDCAEASSEPESVLVRVAVGLRLSRQKVPAGGIVRLRTKVRPCGGHKRDKVVLFRVVNGKMAKVARKRLNNKCVAVFRQRVMQNTAFQTRWPKQDVDHLRGKSRRKAVLVR